MSIGNFVAVCSHLILFKFITVSFFKEQIMKKERKKCLSYLVVMYRFLEIIYRYNLGQVRSIYTYII